MSGDGGLVEVQATAERTPVSRASLDELLALAEPAIALLGEVQEEGGRRGHRGLMPRPRAVVATRNEHKLRELGEILDSLELVPLPDDVELPPEDGETFADNALGKARAAHDGDRDWRRSPTTRGSRRGRSAAGPGCARPATRAPRRATRRT